MLRRYKLAIAVAAVLSVLVVGTAVAATRALSPGQERQAIINDAARQLGVEPKALSDALKQALKNRVDAAVKDGRLTQEEAARLKERIDAGDAPLFGPGPGPEFRHDFHHEGPFPAKSEAAARYLDMTEAQLREALEGGRTLAQVARDRGKSVDGLVDALIAPAEQKLARAVDDGRLTRAEKNEMLSRLREHLTDVVNGRVPPPFRAGPGHEGPFPAKFDAAARYLGMTEAELRQALESGKTLAQVAREQNKSVEGLVDALVAPAEQKLDRAVEEGHLTLAEKREMLTRLREHLTDVVNGRMTPRFDRGPDRAEFEVRPATF